MTYTNHAGHGCPSEKLEQQLNQLDAETTYGQNARPNRMPSEVRVELTHPMATELQPLVTQILSLVTEDVVNTAADFVADRYVQARRDDHERFDIAVARMAEQAEVQAAALGQQRQEITDAVAARQEVEAKLQRKAGEVQVLSGALTEAKQQIEEQTRTITAYQDQVNSLWAELKGGRELWTTQRAALDERGQEIVRLNGRLDEAFALIREQDSRGQTVPVEEVSQCPEGGPGACTSPGSHPLLTDTWAVPRCLANRWAQANEANESTPADLCVSEHCERCNAYRRSMGLEELVPNGWLRELSTAEAIALPETQEALEQVRGVAPSPVVWFDPTVAPSEGDGAAEAAATRG